jgi:hypothetical protein
VILVPTASFACSTALSAIESFSRYITTLKINL